MKKIFFIILTIVSFITTSCYFNINYQIATRFNVEKQSSTLYLKKNNVLVDSITDIPNYYGKDSIIKIDSLHWIYIYAIRAGSGVHYQNQKLITIKDNKLHSLYDDVYAYGYFQPVKDSNGYYSSSELIEYDSVQIFRKDTIWYTRKKSFIEGKYKEEESVLPSYDKG